MPVRHMLRSNLNSLCLCATRCGVRLAVPVRFFGPGAKSVHFGVPVRRVRAVPAVLARLLLAQPAAACASRRVMEPPPLRHLQTHQRRPPVHPRAAAPPPVPVAPVPPFRRRGHDRGYPKQQPGDTGSFGKNYRPNVSEDVRRSTEWYSKMKNRRSDSK